MKKRLFAALVLGCMLIGMTAGCGSKDNKEASSAKTSTASTVSDASKDASKDASEASKQESKKESKTETASKSESSAEKKESSVESKEDSEAESSVEESSEEPSVQESSEEESQAAESSTEAPAEESSQAEPEPSEVELSEPEAPPAQGSFTVADMGFVYNGSMVVPGSDMESALSVLGAASSVNTAPSCIGVGEDKIYTYSGFTVESFPATTGETVLNITLTGASASTAKGVTVGMTADDIAAAYGTPTEADDFFISYNTGSGMHLDFLMDGGKIIEIAYVLDV